MNMYVNVALIPTDCVFLAHIVGRSYALCVQCCNKECPLSKTPEEVLESELFCCFLVTLPAGQGRGSLPSAQRWGLTNIDG